MSIADKLLGRTGTLQLAGSMVPKFERSALHAGARLAVKPLNDVLGIEDTDGAIWAKFAGTKAGQDIVESLKSYVLMALDGAPKP